MLNENSEPTLSKTVWALYLDDQLIEILLVAIRRDAQKIIDTRMKEAPEYCKGLNLRAINITVKLASSEERERLIDHENKLLHDLEIAKLGRH